ncbi:MAG: YjbH domain-containing protein [Armatimonadota bacterium]|nr:YjbH domain-containing protein [Armatimonadota bacterium]
MHMGLMRIPTFSRRRRFVLALCSLLATALGAVASEPAAAQHTGRPLPPMSASGTTGLLRIPTAEVIPYGNYVLGLNKIDRKYRPYPADEKGDSIAHFVSVGVLPRLEVTARITNHDGKLGVQYRDDIQNGLGGWNFDRMFSVHYLLHPQTRRVPVSLAAGSQDCFGTGVFGADYLVLSRRWPRLGAHLGVGNGTLSGLFGGVDWQPTPRLTLLFDYDTNHSNIGLTYQWGRFRFTPMLNALRALGGGITYAGPL